MFKCCASRPTDDKGRRPNSEGTARERVKIKCVAVGDGAVGKTCLLVTYAENKFPQEYVPTTFDNYQAHKAINLHNRTVYVDLELWDTAGQEGYEEMRKLSYLDTDVFLIMFSLDRRTSFDNVRTHWHQELRRCPEAGNLTTAKVVLVGTKSDLQGGPHGVTDAEGEALAREIGAYAYIGASAKFNRRVEEVFDYVIKAKVLPVDADKNTAISAGGGGDVGRPQLNSQPSQPQPQQQPPWQQQAAVAAYSVPTPAPTVQPGIPQGWEKRQHSDGRDYYVDHSTKTTHWNPPAGYSD